MKKLEQFLQKHVKKIILGAIVTLAILHFFINFDLVQNTKLIEESWINQINGFILVISMTFGVVFLIWLIFFMSKETAKDLEKFLLKNLTTACFLVIFYLLFKGKDLGLDTVFIITAIGAVLVFWYGYKTYERDKELQMIEKFDKGELTIESFDEDLSRLAHAFYLHEKGYVPDHIWQRIDIKNDELIFNYLEKQLTDKLNSTELREALSEISFVLGRLKYQGGFLDYFYKKMENIYKELDNGIDFSQQDREEMEKISDLIPKLAIKFNSQNN